MQQSGGTNFVLVSVEQLALLTQLTRNHTDREEVMSFYFEDEKTHTRTTHEINLRHDSNKIADEDGNTWLHLGARAGSDRMIRGFIEQGGKDLDLNVRNRADETPLIVATKASRQKIVEILLEGGADVNACQRLTNDQGWTALHLAAMKGDTQIVKVLLEKDAKITEADLYTAYERTCCQGCTPLIAACIKGNEESIKMLVHAGDNPHQVLSDGTNALHHALANRSNPGVPVHLINEYKINVNQQTKDGRTPLFYATTRELITSLIENGADVNHIADRDGWSPLYCASLSCSQENIEQIKTLLEFGANPNLQVKAAALERITPFEAFARRIGKDSGWRPTPKIVLELTQLFLTKGAKINSNIKGYFDLYLEIHKIPELRKLIRENYDSCLLS